MKIKRIYNIALSILFLIVITGVLFIFLFSRKAIIDKKENRVLSVKPNLNIAKLDPFPRAYEEYFNDHFPYRNSLIKTYSKINIYCFKKSPMPKKVVIGFNNWLFFGDFQLETYQGITQFSDKELKSIEDELIYRQDYCKKRDIKFYFFIIPQKHTIYSENIPYYYSRMNNQTIKDQLVDYLNVGKRVKAYDLEAVLRAEKNKYRVFKKYDNHWNDIGAFCATNEICRIIQKDFPKIKTLDFSDYRISHKIKREGNIAQMLGMEDEFQEECLELIPKFKTSAKDGVKKNYPAPENFPYPWNYEVVKQNPKAANLKVLVIRESFAEAQIKFYQEIFGECVFIFDDWKHELNEDIIESEKPDVVILQVLECFLPSILNYQSRPLE